MARRPERRHFGQITKLPSGRFRARYSDPEGRLTPAGEPVRHNAPHTFESRVDAEGWLTDERRRISSGTWTTPEARRLAARLAEQSRLPTFGNYAARWIDERRVKGRALAPRTQDAYRDYLERFLAPTFGHLHLDELTPGMVNQWFDQLRPKRKGRADSGDAQRAKVYSFARAVMNSAVSAHGPMPGGINPFAVRGAGVAPYKRRDAQVVTGEEFAAMLATIRVNWRPMLLLAMWCGLRYSEIASLRRTDIDLKMGTVTVSKAVSRSRSGVADKDPKSEAGNRVVRIPSHVLPEIKAHLRASVNGRDGLLFPGTNGMHLAPATFYGKLGEKSDGWYAARHAAGRDDVTFHDLRASGATLMSQDATEAEVQQWLGDSTPQAAQRYVRASRSRMAAHADRLSALAELGKW